MIKNQYKVTNEEIWVLYSENRELLWRYHIIGELLPIGGFHNIL